MTTYDINEITAHNLRLYNAEFAIANAPIPLIASRQEIEQIEDQQRIAIAALRDQALPWPGMRETAKNDPARVSLFEVRTRKQPMARGQVSEAPVAELPSLIP